MYYYEVTNSVPATDLRDLVEPGIYRARRAPVDMPPAVVLASSRVWSEHGTEVSCFDLVRELPVDMNEFLWIKMRARNIQ